MSNFKENALSYAGLGLAVFPLKAKGKTPLTSHGVKDATKDLKQIEKWWDKWQEANIGIATGEASAGLIAIDLDVKPDKGINGLESLKKWQSERGLTLPADTWVSTTGSGGKHIFYRYDKPIKNMVGIYPGVDVRASGGYIVAPPSIHENGNPYKWDRSPFTYELKQADDTVINFITEPAHDSPDKPDFKLPGTIPEGERNTSLFQLACSMRAKGTSESAIYGAVALENTEKCVPPLPDSEIDAIVKSSLRYENGTAPYYRSQSKKHNLDMVTMADASEKTPDWLIQGYIPKYQITTIAGDGGSGKTTVWCALAAAISSGKPGFFENSWEEQFPKEPQKVVFFSAEDSYEYTLKRRLRKNGANLANILTIDIADDRFQYVKFNNAFLDQLLDHYRPTLCIFDPIQAFVPPDIHMGDRNAMRACLAPLIGYGKKYKTTFIIISHANKQSGVWGRKRIADSADIWDISRSVIMAGETDNPNIRYLSHEKSNYSQTGNTILYSIADEIIQFKGFSNKKDRDFIASANYTNRQLPQRESAKELILDFLADKESVPVSELNEYAEVMSISEGTLNRAKSDLRKEGKIKSWSEGYGNTKKWYVSLIAT